MWTMLTADVGTLEVDPVTRLSPEFISLNPLTPTAAIWVQL